MSRKTYGDIMIKSDWGGHPAYLNDETQEWHYMDGTLVKDEKRKCPVCKCTPGDDGHDPCIRNLPWVRVYAGACCGHGIRMPFTTIDYRKIHLTYSERFYDVVELFEIFIARRGFE